MGELFTKNILILLAHILLVSYAGCAHFQDVQSPKEVPKQDNTKAKPCEREVEYYPMHPQNYLDYYSFFDYFEGKASAHLENLKKEHRNSGQADNNKVLSLFPNETSRVHIEEINASGSLSYGVASVSGKNKIYHVTVDYLKYRTDSLKSVVYVSGVGLRLVAKIKTFSAGIDLSSLFALGAAASAKRASGELEFESIGISGKQITPLVPVPTNLSIESVTAAMQALAAIKAKIYEAGGDVKIWPQIAGTVGGTPVENLKHLLDNTISQSPNTKGGN